MNGLEPAGGTGAPNPLRFDALELGALRDGESRVESPEGPGVLGLVAGGARQGHAYSWRGNKVIAMESGAFPRVSYIDPAWQWCSPPFHVKAEELTPEPMAYFHGEVPR